MLNLTISEFLGSLSHQIDLPIVAAGGSLKKVVRAMVKGHRRSIVYVVDSSGKLKGTISLSDLKDIIFRYYLDVRVKDSLVVTEHIEELFSSENAEDVMHDCPVFCHKHEKLHDVIVRMIEHDITHIPLIDTEGRVISDLDILDLLELWLKKGEEIF
ncbi:MAG TPA: CBS domain-containing protein [Deltaproteobacteria bacterium]|nr:CBS domain-containing protein [Deltaproteobacteria bacterium]